MPDFEELLAGAVLREVTVPVCLDGAASAELDDAQAAVDGLGEWVPASMGDANPAVALIGRAEAARAAVQASVVQMRFRALGSLGYSSLLAAHPAPKGSQEPFDAGTFLPALLERCCVEPVLSRPQVMVLLDRINDGQARQLYAAALAVNEEASPVPF